MRTRMISAALAIALLGPAACKVEKTEREMLVEASLAAQTGRADEARQIFETAYEANPDSAEVLIRYTGFLIDNDQLDRAAELLAQLDGVELAAADEGRVDTERRRYFDQIYEDSHGEGPSAPADVEAYETALIGLISLDRNGPQMAEWAEYLLFHGRAALGAPGGAAIAVVDANNPAARATAAQATAALGYFDRLVDGDERLTARPRLDEAVRAEVEAVRQILRATVFRAEFDARFASELQPALVAAGRFDATTRTFTLAHSVPLPAELPADSSPELLQQQAQTYFAREIASDLAYELAGSSRAGAEPLGFVFADFADVVASDIVVAEPVEAAADGSTEAVPAMLSFRVAIPYRVVQRGAWLLNVRQQTAPAAAEGSGAGAGEGSGT